MHCLADTELIQLVDGSLPSGLAASFEAHIDACERCFQIVASVLRGQSSMSMRGDRGLRLNAEPLPPPEEAPGATEIGRRYLLLSLLGQGGMGRVYRAFDRLSGREVALKRVLRGGPMPPDVARTTVLPQAEPVSYARCLEQEFRLLATLRHPNIISVLDYGFDDQLLPYFTMELLDGAQPILPFALALSLPARVELLLQFLHALGYLHRRGILHRDLKPNNLLVVPEPGGRVTLKLLDFGLSSGPDGLQLADLAGTLAYMAPELLRGEPPSVASDLYAAGMVIYEVLAGCAPFSFDGRTTGLLLKVLREPPDLSRLARLPPAVGALLGRTLSKEAHERPADVASLLRGLCAATGTARPEEPPAVRDSFLIAARFVNRGVELGTLASALLEAQAGRGAAWLLGGESGAGKSRLLEELRSLALLSGVVVARGQAISDGGTAYQAWQEVLRVLALHLELGDHEVSVLGAILPGLAALLERPVVPPPEEPEALDPQIARLQRLRVLRELLLRVSRPVLILLEDLHWADAESLALLAHISSGLASCPVLLVATYRDDETPRLPSTLPGARVLRLGRLVRHELALLCESMLGEPGRDPVLLDRIERETEGNTYFVVEVVRALAEEAGSLDEIGRRSLPQRLFAGGVEQVLARRLRRVPADAGDLLQLAAVMGRQLDLAVLATLYRDRDALIQQCMEAGVLDVQEQNWRFSHDKLREQILARLSSTEQQTQHARIAAALEKTYESGALPTAQLARHHHLAQQLDRAAHYYGLAGAEALARGAPTEAAAALEQAVALQDDKTVPLLTRVQVWRRLAQARYALGQLRGTDQALRQVCTLVGWPLPTGAAGVAQSLARQGGRQLKRMFSGAQQAANTPESELRRALDRELMIALLVEEIYVWLCEPGLTLVCALRGLELAEHLDAAPQRKYFRAAVAFLMSFTRLGALGVRYLERAPSAAGTVGEIDSLRTQAIVAMNEGRLTIAAERATQAVLHAREQRDDFALMYSLLQQQLTLCELEDFARVLAVSHELAQIATVAKNPRYLVIALTGQLGAHLRFGQLDQVEVIFARACAQDADEIGAVAEAVLYGLAAMSSRRRGDQRLAIERADRAMDAIVRARWPLLQLRFALIGVLEAYLASDENTLRTVRPKIKHALRTLGLCALQFTRLRPIDALYRGIDALLQGRLDSARRHLQRSLREAEQHGTRFEQAQAHYWLGQLLRRMHDEDRPPDHGDRSEAEAHLQSALSLFEMLGATWDVLLCRRALGHSAGRSETEQAATMLG